MAINDALICAYAFDGSGRAAEIDGLALESRTADTGWVWAHLDRTNQETEHWLRETAGLEPLVIDALLEEETRPRSVSIGAGLLVILRGVNLNVGANPEDMVSIRVWIDAGQVITLRNRRIMAVQDLRESIEKGDVPASPGSLLVEIAAYMIDRMAPVLADLNDEVDELEEEVLEAPGHELRTKLSRNRRQAISLRRFLAPLREVLTRLYTDRTALFDDTNHGHLREIADRLTRYIEELDSARDRAAITQEELAGRLADEMNKNMYVLSIVAGIFLPLGLLTGLLGINVGGIPGTQSNWAFTIVCIILVGLAIAVLWLFRRFRIL